ncbi:MAG: DUF3189 family protein [Peptococcaceae bacterium]|nr:DUF3189 family protein [Peptococcaceae bacterium]
MKRILYFSDSKLPLAALAGAIHTGRLPAGRVPGKSQLWGQLFLNIRDGEGNVVSLGSDEQGDKIYALSVKGERGMVHRLVESFQSIYNIPEDELNLVDSGVRDNLYLLAGRLLCGSRFLAPLGYSLAAAGIKKIYGRLAELVHDVKTVRSNLP